MVFPFVYHTSISKHMQLANSVGFVNLCSIQYRRTLLQPQTTAHQAPSVSSQSRDQRHFNKMWPVRHRTFAITSTTTTSELPHHPSSHGNQTFRTIDFSYHRRFVPFVDFSYHGRFVPWTFRTILDFSYRSYHGLFVPS